MTNVTRNELSFSYITQTIKIAITRDTIDNSLTDMFMVSIYDVCSRQRFNKRFSVDNEFCQDLPSGKLIINVLQANQTDILFVIKEPGRDPVMKGFYKDLCGTKSSQTLGNHKIDLTSDSGKEITKSILNEIKAKADAEISKQ